jgi:hypothetical protein
MRFEIRNAKQTEPNGIELTGKVGNPYSFHLVLVLGARCMHDGVQVSHQFRSDTWLLVPLLFRRSSLYLIICSSLHVSTCCYRQLRIYAGFGRKIDLGPALATGNRLIIDSYALRQCLHGHQPKTRKPLSQARNAGEIRIRQPHGDTRA